MISTGPFSYGSARRLGYDTGVIVVVKGVVAGRGGEEEGVDALPADSEEVRGEVSGEEDPAL
jgi:hypothetical protein